MRNLYRLRDELHQLVRVQETHVDVLMELIHRYLKPGSRAIDICSGSGSFLLAMIAMGVSGDVNDYDEHAMDLAVTRSKYFLAHLLNKRQYPQNGVRMQTKYSFGNSYAWMHETKMGPERSLRSDILDVPQTTRPSAMPDFKSNRQGYNAFLALQGLVIVEERIEFRRKSIDVEDHYPLIATTVPRKKGDEIHCGVWGTYLKRLDRGQETDNTVIQVIFLLFSFF